MDKKAIEKAITDLLIAVGEDIEREGLVETPKRVAGYWAELLEGTQYTNDEIADMFNKTFTAEDKQIVEVRDIKCFSHCEHHMALMYDMTINISYIPNEKVLGLSKFARICDMVTKRLQIQERIGKDIWYILNQILDTDKIEVNIRSKHSCMSARGIKNTDAYTETTYGSLYGDTYE